MATLKLKDHLSQAELKHQLATAKNIRAFRQWQVLNAVSSNPGLKSERIASLLGTTATIVQRYVRLYNKHGSGHFASLQWGGRRQARALLSFEQEEGLLAAVAENSLKGEILTAKDIRAEVEQAVKRSVSDDYLWDLFKRHGWKKKAPRPKHPMQAPAAQDEFKKNSLNYWQPASRSKGTAVR